MKLLFSRELKTILFDIQPNSTNIEDVHDRDYQHKMQGKIHAHVKRQAKQSNINKGHLVILKQDKGNKMTKTQRKGGTK